MRRLLVALDGSPPSEAALALALLIPSRSVHLLRTEHPATSGMLATISPDAAASWRADSEREMQATLQEAARPFVAQGRDVTLTATFAEPAEAIIREAANADLIVMGTHGRGGARRALIGSVADRVARSAPVATLLARGGETPTSAPRISRLVVPLDGSDLAQRALPVAVDLATDLDVPIHLVMVIDSEPVRETVRGGAIAARALAAARSRLEQEGSDYLAATANELLVRNAHPTWEIRLGNPAAEILASLTPGDLLVMTTHGRGGLARWLLGSVADRLVREADVPVLLIRPGASATTGAAGSIGGDRG